MAQTTADQNAGGFSFSSLLLPILLALFIFMMFRKQKKTQQTVQQQRTQMVPGTEVMTQFGLFGTILSINSEENKAVLELSPGNTATVHLQALTKVVTTEPAVEEEAPVVPDDASSLTAADQADDAPRTADPVRRDDSAAHPDETPEETLERLNRENKKEN
ncbi:preprotein translocase subunit YajC [Arthrobacter sp. zg-ZUI10]|uniref:Preprotein translocase subunit YajC n=2 Tax=Arthrobacter TaxID=1663 RepID=A0A975XMR4_9MICC|nr:MULTISPECIES: preprotein translocase subunit YajC [Arthrobacter]MBO0895777.1 preprotein translocase subunit YajC [Arthrobacter sunyaminii]MBO0907431.1 preprotein translocase subunit YajC [Arthrobacter sunyaminii]QWQ38017.1 preprotein translocase subunit YajC [Arthrobacter sunyaminii]